MEEIYNKSALELGLKGWNEYLSVVCDGSMRALWKKNGDIAEWQFLMEKDEGDEGDGKMLCALVLKTKKELGARMRVHPDVLRHTSIEVMIESLKKAIIRLLDKELKGGSVWQNI